MRLPHPQVLMTLLLRSTAALLIWHPLAVAVDEPAVDCVITPYLTVDVSSATPGVIEKVYVERGDRVAQNQIVAALDSDVEKAAVDIAKARSTMVSEVMLSKVNVDYDERKQQRLSSLYTQEVVSTQDKDEAERNAKAARLKLQHATDLQRLRKLELRKAEEELRQRVVHSPIQGVVVQRYKYSAEYVEDQPILRIAQLDPLNIEAIVPMEMFGKIQVGMSADVFPQIVSDGARQATVTVVDKMGDAASGTFGVRLTMANPANALPAGVKCHAQFDLDSVPEQASTYGQQTAPINGQDEHPPDSVQRIEMQQTQKVQLAMLGTPQIPARTAAVVGGVETSKVTEGERSGGHQNEAIASAQYDDYINTLPKIGLRRPVVNVRAEPDHRGAIIHQAGRSDAIYKIEDVQGWFKVYLPQKDTVGYMAGFLLDELTDEWQP